MVEQTGEEIDWDKCPPEADDFPQLILDTMNIYNSLGNRMYPEIGYMGKDFTNFSFLTKLYGIEEHQHEYLMELLLFLDSQAIDASQKRIKAEYDKIKKK